MLNYKVISSGSQCGNCFRVENILIDIGVNFNVVKPYIDKYKIKAIFISHRHSDHYHKTTYHQISTRYPYIKFIVNSDVANAINEDYPNHIDNLTVIKDNTNITIPSFNNEYQSLVVNVFHTDHEIEVLTNGYYGVKINKNAQDENFVFATDFWNIDNLPNEKLDYIFLEANYNEENLAKSIELLDVPKWSIKGSYRHFSKEKSYQYYVQHKKENTVYIPLHKSNRFYGEFDESTTPFKKKTKKEYDNCDLVQDELNNEVENLVNEDNIDLFDDESFDNDTIGFVDDFEE